MAFDDLTKKAQEAAKDHPEQAEKISDQAIEKGGDAADKATGDKFGTQVDQAQTKADDAIG